MRSLIFFLVLFAAVAAQAQTSPPFPDVPLRASAGVFPFACMMPGDLDLAKLCAVRTDLGDPLELGCVEATEPNKAAALEVTLETTPSANAEIRCYAVDTAENKSDISPNAGIADFTPPGAPTVIDTLSIAWCTVPELEPLHLGPAGVQVALNQIRLRAPAQAKHLVLEVMP